jgi:iron complex transport system ATP-binding protein
MIKLRLQNVTLGYGKKITLSDITMEANPGEIVGIIGPNGSGKTTLIRGMTRLISPISGNIHIDGRNIRNMKTNELAQYIAVVPQNTELPKLFTAFEVVLMGRTPHLGLLRYEGKNDIAIVRKAMDATQTWSLAQRRVGELSGGEIQRIIIARALAQEPHIMLFDEPTAHLDINYQIEILDLVRRLCLEQNLIILVALHDLNLASQYCSRLIILHDGKIHSQGDPRDVINEKTIKEVFGAHVYITPHPVNKLPSTFILSNQYRGEHTND